MVPRLTTRDDILLRRSLVLLEDYFIFIHFLLSVCEENE